MHSITTPRELTQDILALRSVRTARVFWKAMNQQADDESRAEMYNALCVCYLRPFTNCNGFGPLPRDVVPDTCKETHEKLELHRHKAGAHTDADYTIQGTAVNALYFRRTHEGIYVESPPVTPTPSFYAEIGVLLDAVESCLSSAISECLNHGPPSRLTLSEGFYKLTVDGSGGWHFEPALDHVNV